MRILHTMLRVRDLDKAMHFYCNLLGLEEVRRRTDEKAKYTLVFLAAPEDAAVHAAVRERVRQLCGRFPLYELHDATAAS